MAPPPPGASADEYEATLRSSLRERFADEPLPALDGRTPRQAAAEPAFRGRLLQVMKLHVRSLDAENLRTGRRDDINGLIRELGLAEIDFPPPPPREPPLLDADELEDEEGELWPPDLPAPEENRPPAPVLTGPPLSVKQAEARFQDAIMRFDTAADGRRELAASGSELCDAVDELASERLDQTAVDVLQALLMPAWFALVPMGVRARRLDFGAMDHDYWDWWEQVAESEAPSGRLFLELHRQCRQPGLLQMFTSQLVAANDRIGAPLDMGPEATREMVVIAKVIIDALDAALRAPPRR